MQVSSGKKEDERIRIGGTDDRSDHCASGRKCG